ncbi:MAG TPA: OmpH family outer membrane protein [Pyrinomonadaceae bacterium]|nr:OmpH family outer membrane protein [Pyrinomonadaceae bacterium]
MKAIRHTVAAAALAVFAALGVNAQAPAGGRTATPATATPRPAAPAGGQSAIAEGKFAVVDTDAFQDPKEGIARLVSAAATVDREFKPRRDEIQQLQTRYEALGKQIQDTQKVSDPNALRNLAEQAETLKSDIERKQQDGQRAIQKRWAELSGPIFTDINNALRAYAQARGISVVFDLSKMEGVVMVVNPQGIDLTAGFIADYNQRNPASTAAAGGGTPGRP